MPAAPATAIGEYPGGGSPLFLGSLALFLGLLAWSSHRRLKWGWWGAVAAYAFGIIGSAWEISIGINNAWVSLLINSAVVTILLRPDTRKVYFK